MFAIIAFSALIAASAFAPMGRVSSRTMTMYDAPGALPPVGFFDPLNLSEGKSDDEMKKIREAELKHGRLAMMASLGWIVAEKFHPLFNGQIDGPAITHFQKADDLLGYFWVIVLFGVGITEGQNIIVGWETKPGASVATLKDDYVNGDLGFDPLGLKPDDAEEFDVMRTKELQNGRLAMLGIAGMVAQEAVSGTTLF